MLVHEGNILNESSELKQLTYDEALTQVGGAGLYQKRAFLIFGLQWLITNWILFSPVFFFIEPTVDCKNNGECLDKCLSESLDDNCLNYICDDSERRQFVVGESLNTAFNSLLPCNKSLQSIIKSIVYIGSLTGFFVFSFIADNYGRKLALSISWGMTTLGSLLLAFAMNYSMIAIGIFLLGFGGNPAITVHYSFINEHSQGHFREIQNVGVQVFFAIGEFTIISLAYFITKWRWLAISVAIPTILLNLCNFLIFESPQFLYSKNKKKCVKVLNQIAKINGTQPLAMNDLASNPQSKENNSRVYTIWDLLKYKSLRYVFFAGLMMFFAIQVTYYGISFVSDQLGLDFFLSNFIIAFFELLAYATTDFFITKLNRKKNIIGGFFIVGFMSLYFIFKSDHVVYRVFQGILAGLMRFLICVVWALGYVYVSELFPSVVRSLALCLISAGGSLGSIVQAFLINVCASINIHPMVAFGLIGFLCSLLLFPLRETLHQPLLEKIEEDNIRIRKSMLQINESEEITTSIPVLESNEE
ncbi:unnamed protein product [Paramecium sonneborni]|uniref:Major facilitator superfamily (MFS) profile domain-containing protein n=1 Tax=Paramecium sonneborni TaxID=65129 RepID=A0A8S1Q5V2_9CILI|nr:unnamed protein product [Paramecium sonneborni]